MDIVLARANDFVRWCPNASDRERVHQWLKAYADKAQQSEYSEVLKTHFEKRINFGTAGLRAAMAPGYSKINSLVVIQTTQGVCRYAQQNIIDLNSKGAVIGYDGRHNSYEYASIAAAVLLSQGVKVNMYSDMIATPFVPFGVSQLKAGFGIMITASHNPKEDNGYKLYWENGAQIIPPHDGNISDFISDNLEPWSSFDLDRDHELLSDPTNSLTKSYLELALQQCSFNERVFNESSKVRIVYTAMHGVGAHWVEQAFKTFHLPPIIPVAEQNTPDPEFPTVKFPNPEEGKGALALAFNTAADNNATLILANDPDADRLAVAEQNKDEWYIFNGNEIGALFADWIWRQYRQASPQEDLSKACMVASTVSSKFLQAMAKIEGFHFQDTLTGFKWLSNVAIGLEHKGYKFLFAYEVEIGFLIGNMSMDKDGIRTAAVFAEMATSLQQQGMTCLEKLHQLQKKYGYFEMNTSYFFCDSRETLDKVFVHLREGGEDKSYIRWAGKYEVKSIRDVTTGFDDAQPDNKSVLPIMQNDQMITFTFANGCVCTIRNSGTEPKLKYYIETSDSNNRELTHTKLIDMTHVIVDEFIRPKLLGLTGPTSTQ